jgi:cytochrome b subunit of formate dehydrogenase
LKNEAKINYWVDILIGIAFVIVAFSGLVRLFAGPSGGCQGGRNPLYLKPILFFSRSTWKELHNWSGILMILGVLGHFVLHWNCLACMTRNLFRKSKLSSKKMKCCSTEG